MTVSLPQEAIIIPATVSSVVILVLIVIAIVVPIVIIKVFITKRQKAMIYLEELSARKGTPDPENHYGNDYIKNKLFQGKCCIISILTVCTMWIVGKRTATIKQEYLPLISSNLVIYNEQLRLLDSVGQGE